MSENENDFDALRRLLALKRHEIAPPGYFENFSSQVIGRIRAGETAAELPFLLKFVKWFEGRPALPVGFASSLCLILLYGIVSIQQTPGIATVWGAPSGQSSITSISPAASLADVSQPWNSGSTSTNPPSMSTAEQLFGSQPSGPAYTPQTAGFSLGN